MVAEKKSRNNRSSYKPGDPRVNQDVRLAVYIRDNFQCLYCCKDLRVCEPWELTLDHVICRSTGTIDHSPSNLFVACTYCNSSRQDKTIEEYCQIPAILDRIKSHLQMMANIKLARAIRLGHEGNPRYQQ